MIRSKIDIPLRILGSILVIVGWFVMIHIDVTIGAGLSLLGDCLALPYFMRTRAWDVVVMIVFLHSVTIHKLSQAVFTSAGF